MMVDPVMVGAALEFALACIKMAEKATEQAGLTEEERKRFFDENYPKFKARPAAKLKDV